MLSFLYEESAFDFGVGFRGFQGILVLAELSDIFVGMSVFIVFSGLFESELRGHVFLVSDEGPDLEGFLEIVLVGRLLSESHVSFFDFGFSGGDGNFFFLNWFFSKLGGLFESEFRGLSFFII